MNDYHRYVCPHCGHILFSIKGNYTCPICRHLMMQKDIKRHQTRPVILFAILVVVFLSALLFYQNHGFENIFKLSLPWQSKESSTEEPVLQAPETMNPTPLSTRTPDLHQKLLNGMLERNAVITVYGYEIDEIKKETHTILCDHPELFWVSSVSYLIQRSDFGTKTEITPIIYDVENVAAKEDQLNSIVYGISSLIPEDASDYEKALFVHDYIVNTTEYDHEAAAKDEYSDASCAYGCLVNHKAVCGGYAKAYKLMMDYLGIPCNYVTGDIIDRGLHAWNTVTINGISSFVDVTWDDAVFSDGETEGLCSHEYFCVTTQELSRTHNLDPEQDIPRCDSSDCDYFRVNQLYIEDDPVQQAITIIKSSSAEKWMEMTCLSPRQALLRMQRLVTTKRSKSAV